MKKKIFFVLLVLLMATVSVGFAAVTVTIDNLEGKAENDSISIPVNITGFDKFLAGELVFDFGDTALEDITIEGGAGTLFPNGLEDYSAVAVLQDMIDKNGWEDSKDAAIDYEVSGSTVRIYLYGPYATSEVAGGVPDGVLFNINGTIGAGAKSSILNFGGKVFNANVSLRKDAPVLTNDAVLNITGETAVIIVDVDAVGDAGNVTDTIRLPANGTVPTKLTLKPVDTTVANVEVTIEADTVVKLEDGTVYDGIIMPPKPVNPEDLTKEQKEKLEDVWQEDEDLVFITMGNPGVKLEFDKPMLVTLTIVRASDAPAFTIYYLPENADPEVAGITGFATIDGVEGVGIAKGGTILETAEDTPVAGKTTYTVGVLLDHMSSFVASSTLPAAAATTADDGGSSSDCFINTVSFDSNSVGLLAGLMAMVMALGGIGCYLKRKREFMS